jgi:alkylation response protein AidB-like acyl-CoA dehydrogenase
MAALGWTALGIPERWGGAGPGWVELGAIVEEAGRVLSAPSLIGTLCLGAGALAAAGTEEQKGELLPEIVAGELRVALVLEGRALDGANADLFVIARGDELVLARAAEVARRPLATLDPTRTMSLVQLHQNGSPMAGGRSSLEPVLARARIALAAEQLGGAERCLEMAVDYAKTRHQFGRPIGSFQAIKHTLADLLVRIESARSAAYWAAWVAAVDDSELPTAAALAGSWCAETFFRAAADNLQIHGGIGFTWEHDAHWYLRRARAGLSLLGDPATHRETIAGKIA